MCEKHCPSRWLRHSGKNVILVSDSILFDLSAAMFEFRLMSSFKDVRAQKLPTHRFFLKL